MKYQTAYFCGYAKLPSALPTTTTNGSITLGLKINLETACIEDVSVTFLSNLALSMCREYFVGKNILRDYDEIVEEIGYRHQGAAAKSIIKAFGDIHRNYIEYMRKTGRICVRIAERSAPAGEMPGRWVYENCTVFLRKFRVLI